MQWSARSLVEVNIGVKEYWIVDPETKLAMVFVLKDGIYKLTDEKTGFIHSPLLGNDFTF
jgi:Uma2 family endonuclease